MRNEILYDNHTRFEQRLDVSENFKQILKSILRPKRGYGDCVVICKGNNSLFFSETRRLKKVLLKN